MWHTVSTLCCMQFQFWIGKFLIKTQQIAARFYLGYWNQPWFGPAGSENACVFCMRKRCVATKLKCAATINVNEEIEKPIDMYAIDNRKDQLKCLNLDANKVYWMLWICILLLSNFFINSWLHFYKIKFFEHLWHMQLCMNKNNWGWTNLCDFKLRWHRYSNPGPLHMWCV